MGLSLLACGCATMPGDRPYYFASGDNPQWTLSFSEGGRIRLAVGRAERHQVSPLEVLYFPPAVPAVSGARTIWTASASGKTIVIEAEFVPGAPCSPNGPDRVRVVVDGREYRGCGGQQILVRAH